MRKLAWRVAQPCFLSKYPKWGCPILRALAKGGNHTAGAMGFGLNCAGMGSMTKSHGKGGHRVPALQKAQGWGTLVPLQGPEQKQRKATSRTVELHTDSFSEKM
jgi:hypothetical protein